MEKLSGLVLDAYDDPQGIVMQEIYPDGSSPPELLKEAQALTASEREQLPDRSFALVLVDGDVELKKFATVDKGNTVLSVEYFLKTAHKLPEEAQKVAAQNLVAACGWHRLSAPEGLQKLAFGVANMLGAALVAPGAASTAKQRIGATRGMATPMSPRQQDTMAKMRGGR